MMHDAEKKKTVQATRYVCACKGMLLVDHESRRVLHSRSAQSTTSGCARFEQLVRSPGGASFEALRTLMVNEQETHDVDASLFEGHSDQWRLAPIRAAILRSNPSLPGHDGKDVLECRDCDTQIAFCPGCARRAVDVFRPQAATGLALLERIRPLCIGEGDAVPPEARALMATELHGAAFSRLHAAFENGDRSELIRAKSELEDATANVLALLHHIQRRLTS